MQRILDRDERTHLFCSFLLLLHSRAHSGTEVTRQAADIILSDDNFSTIVSSVGEGRRIYDNIVKFLVYLLTCNGAEVWVMLFAVILNMDVPFLSLMLLWANIFAVSTQHSRMAISTHVFRRLTDTRSAPPLFSRRIFLLPSRSVSRRASSM